MDIGSGGFLTAPVIERSDWCPTEPVQDIAVSAALSARRKQRRRQSQLGQFLLG
jgi:hypothetical protein